MISILVHNNLKVTTLTVSLVAQWVQCLATGWMTGRSWFDPRQRRENFSSSLCVQTGSGVQLASCTVGTGGSFLRAKARAGRDADHSTTSSAEVENEYELYFLSPQALLWRVVGQIYLSALITLTTFIAYYCGARHVAWESLPWTTWVRANWTRLISIKVGLGGLAGTVFTTGYKVRGFKLGRGRWIFKDDKNA
jgi:hypothetical protein